MFTTVGLELRKALLASITNSWVNCVCIGIRYIFWILITVFINDFS